VCIYKQVIDPISIRFFGTDIVFPSIAFGMLLCVSIILLTVFSESYVLLSCTD